VEFHWHEENMAHSVWFVHAQQLEPEHFCPHVPVGGSHWHEDNVLHSVWFAQAPQFMSPH
jgi:hypothetical protein